MLSLRFFSTILLSSRNVFIMTFWFWGERDCWLWLFFLIILSFISKVNALIAIIYIQVNSSVVVCIYMTLYILVFTIYIYLWFFWARKLNLIYLFNLMHFCLRRLISPLVLLNEAIAFRLFIYLDLLIMNNFFIYIF